MRNFILGLLIALAVPSGAFVKHEDGSVTFDPEEVQALVHDLTTMHEMAMAIEMAKQIILRQQAEIEAFKTGKCI